MLVHAAERRSSCKSFSHLTDFAGPHRHVIGHGVDAESLANQEARKGKVCWVRQLARLTALGMVATPLRDRLCVALSTRRRQRTRHTSLALIAFRHPSKGSAPNLPPSSTPVSVALMRAVQTTFTSQVCISMAP